MGEDLHFSIEEVTESSSSEEGVREGRVELLVEQVSHETHEHVSSSGRLLVALLDRLLFFDLVENLPRMEDDR